jgi:hypothetical protein
MGVRFRLRLPLNHPILLWRTATRNPADAGEQLSADIATAPRTERASRCGVPWQAREPFELSLVDAWKMACSTPI